VTAPPDFPQKHFFSPSWISPFPPTCRTAAGVLLSSSQEFPRSTPHVICPVTNHALALQLMIFHTQLCCCYSSVFLFFSCFPLLALVCSLVDFLVFLPPWTILSIRTSVPALFDSLSHVFSPLASWCVFLPDFGRRASFFFVHKTGPTQHYSERFLQNNCSPLSLTWRFLHFSPFDREIDCLISVCCVGAPLVL